MTGRRTYGEGCAVAHGMDLVGERWAMLIVRDLILGPKRFTDLLTGLPGASPGVLTQRLRELTDAGVLRRRRLGAPAATWVYELTPWGRQLAPIVTDLARWASQSPAMPFDAPQGTDSVMLSLEALFDPTAAGELEAVVSIHLADEPFEVRIAHGELTVRRAEAHDPDVTVRADLPHLLALLRTHTSLEELRQGGALSVVGDTEVLQHFRRLFPMPDPVSPA